MKESETDKKLGLCINAMWKCNNPFTKEELIIELDKNGLILNDFDALLTFCKDFVFKEGDKYRIDISNIPIIK